MAQKKIEELFKEIGKKYNLPAHVVEEVFNSQFKKLRTEINSLEFPIIKLPNWGKYIPSKTKLSRIDYTEKRERLKEKQLKKELNDTNRNQIPPIQGS
jgi:aspartyl/asparaginyl-tRNA synthetase